MSEITEILGNKKNIEHLSKAHAMGKLSHAYIINGPAGSGKKTFVNYIAKGLLCDEMRADEDDGQADLFAMLGAQKPEPRRLSQGACGSCPACVKAASGNHPDIINVTHEKPKLISVDEIRQQVIDDIAVRPYYGPYKIYIIADAQLLNENGQNALLKTIEEPPEYGIIFILTDNAEGLLDTIRSRCIRLDMERLPQEVIAKVLTDKYSISQENARNMAAFAGGNLGKAIDLAKENEQSEFINSIISALKQVHRMNAVRIFEISAELGKSDAEAALGIMQMWFRDMLIIKGAGAVQGAQMYFPAEELFLKERAQKISFEGINNIFRAIDSAAERIRANVKAEAALENLFLSMRRNSKAKRQ